uniref:NADH-ubiquinone oxidoreductase 9 kDa subunit n=1 Tax=Salvator merianae TaxID=96440 RepID=A0A8D0EDU0_SALMN
MALPLLLRCGRVAAFKTFHRQAQGLRNLPAVSLCTKSGDSKKGSTKKAKPPAEMAPEPFDISSYKNLQHHEYTPFTFVDYDVQLSKFRLPQPSSGRLSPRH